MSRFPLGRVVATPGVLEQIPHGALLGALARHQRGDWGDVCSQDRAKNDAALQSGERILSVYRSADDVKFWIITEADRSYTTVLLPSEY